jgi:hypothetical protein
MRPTLVLLIIFAALNVAVAASEHDWSEVAGWVSVIVMALGQGSK